MGTWRVLLCSGALKVMEQGSGEGHLSSWGHSWVTWSGLIYQGGGASLSVGALEGGLPSWGP